MTSLSLFTFMHWRRKWQPSPVFLPGESQGWQGLVGCRLWGRTELDTTEATGKESACQCRRCRRPGFDPCIGKIPWRRKWQVTPVFLPVKFHGHETGGLVHGVSKSQTQLSTSISSLLIHPRNFIHFCCPGWSTVSSVLLIRLHFFSGSGYFPYITTCCLICPFLRDCG